MVKTFPIGFLLYVLLIAIGSPSKNGGVGAADPQVVESNNSSSSSSSSSSSMMTTGEIFNKIDSNHDSSLSLNEFTSAIPYLIKHIPSSPSSSSSSTNGNTFTSGIPKKTDFWNGFTSSTAMIIATEIGDKTFFIAAVLSMRNSRSVVFGGAISALICMTILSTMMGLILPSLIPRQYTHIIGGILFLYFGVKLIHDSRSMEDKVSDELEEVEEELLQQTRKKDENDNSQHKDDVDVETGVSKIGASSLSSTSASSSKSNSHNNNSMTSMIKNRILLQSFLLTFLAEWGDRSQIATIALAASKDPYGVTLGGCFGHSLCTGMACVGGRMLASRISEKTVSFWGGFIFLGFSIHSLFFES